MSSAMQQYVREQAISVSSYLQGRLYALPRGPAELLARASAKGMSLLALPLPLLSFLAVPFYGGSSATVSLVLFYLTWSGLLLSHDPLTIEIWGTLVLRLVSFVLPALLFLAFDWVSPRFSRKVKAYGTQHHPGRLPPRKLLEIAGIAVGNVLLAVAAQAALEFVVTRGLRMRSLVRVTAIPPLPWSVFTSILQGLVCRGVLSYAAHRFLLHTYDTPLRRWHLQWQHSVKLPFSLVAAYDHPVNYLVREWLPTYLPAYLFRWHVLTWYIFLVIVSVEELLVWSGYSILPSTIILAGMARRTEAHFNSVSRKRDAVGNFGHTGVLDFILRTTCAEEDDILDDMRSEAEKHGLQERIEAAVQAALDQQHGATDREADEQARSKMTRRKKTKKEDAAEPEHEEEEEKARRRVRKASKSS